MCPSPPVFGPKQSPAAVETILHRHDHLSNLHNLWMSGSDQSSIYGYRKEPFRLCECRAGTFYGSVVAAAGGKEKEEEDATTFLRSSLSPQVEPI